MKPKTPWYDRKFLVVALVFLFFPAGLYGIWKSTKFSKKERVAWIIITIVWILIAGLRNPPPDASRQVASTSEKPAASATKVKPKQAMAATAPAKEQTDDTIIVDLAGEQQSSTPTTPKQESAQQQIEPTAATQEKHLEITLAALIKRYNQSFRAMQQDLSFAIKEKTINGDILTAQLLSNSKHIAAVVSANKESRKVRSMIFIGAGDGSPRSGLNILMGAAATIMAIEDPTMNKEARGQLLADIGFSNNMLKSGVTRSFQRNGVKYTASLNKEIGFMLTADPI